MECQIFYTKGRGKVNFTEKMEQRRKEIGWSQYRLAKESGIFRECIAKMEAGRGHSPTLRVAEKICRALGMSFTIGTSFITKERSQ